MALTKVSGGVIQPDNFSVGVITATSLNASGVVTASTVQVGSATTIHTTGIDLGSGSITSHNINSTGIITASRYIGDADITGGSIVATAATFTGNVSIAGTLTYEDVTNVDSVGIVTARFGIHVTGGSVGIGTDNPGSLLDVRSSASDSGINLGRPNLTPTISLNNNGGQNSGRVIIRHNNSPVIEFRADGNGSYIKSGNVGIGTDNPENKLHISGGSIYHNGTGSLPLYINANSSSGDPDRLAYLQQSVSDTAASILLSGKNSSNVPTHTLLTSSNDGNFYISPGNYQPSQTPKKFTITSSGNVGIGTDSPYSNASFNSLSVGGSGKYGLIELVKSNGVAGSWIDSYGTSGDGNLRFTTAGTSGAITFWTGGEFTEKVRITSSGNVGINTNTFPANGKNLKVSDETISRIALDKTGANARSFTIGNSGTNLNVYDETAGAERLRITSSGDVGIGTTNPVSTLDVYGNLSVGRTNSPYKYCSIGSLGQIVTNVANNGNEYNLVLDNVGDLTSTTNHGSSILYRTSDNSSVSAIDSGRLSILKSQQWTTTTSTRNSHFVLSLASSGTLQNRVKIGGRSGGSQITIFKRDSSPSEDALTGNHQLLFVEPDGDGPAYYRRSIISQYKGINQYSYWAIRYDGASYDYTGSLKCRITWSTSHASGAGFAEFSLAVRSGDSNGGPAPAGNIIQYGAVQYSGGWFYGWTGNPDFDVYYAGFNEDKQFLVLRLSGYMSHNSGTYDGGVHETVDLQSWGNAFQGLYRIGTSAPAGFTLNAVTKTILS